MGEAETRRPRVIGVLGMHRSGTSALTRGLACLGVDLGHELLRSSADENPTGFFEDERILDLSERVLAALGLRWDSTRRIHPSQWAGPGLDALRLEACETLRQRLGIDAHADPREPGRRHPGSKRSDQRIWAFKNPRTARLLPFWRGVFDLLGVDDSYVLVVRNPLSVARSLAKRNGFAPEKSHLLWLLHVTDAVLHTHRKLRLCVDYDDLLEQPRAVLERLRATLELPADAPADAKIDAYAAEFLTPSLRHSQFAPEDLALDARVSDLSRAAFGRVRGWARGEIDSNDPALTREFRRIARALASMDPWLAQLDALDRERATLLEQRAADQLEAERTATAQRAALDAVDAQEQRIQGFEARLQQSARSASEADAVQTQLRAELDEQASARDARERALREELAGVHDEVSAARDELAGERSELSRLRDSLAAATSELADQRAIAAQREEQAHARTAAHAAAAAGWQVDRERLEAQQLERDEQAQQLSARIESLRRDLAEQARALAAATDAVGRQHVELQRLATVESQLSAERATSKRAHAESAEAQQRLVHEQARVGRALGSYAERLLGLAEAIRGTRAWRATRGLQRRLDAVRRAPDADGLETLLREIAELRELARGTPLDLPALLSRIETASAVLRELEASEIFRSVRGAALAGHLARLRRPAPGPLEHVALGLAELGELVTRYASTEGRPRPRPSTSLSVPDDGTVDVVVPVYESREQTLRCIASAIAAENDTPTELIVIDDGSRDEALREELDRLARASAIRLIRHLENRGFTATANHGLSLHPRRDVILLNSDTLVNGDWVDRLRRAAHSDWRVGTATPLSNNAEICSYPLLCEVNPLPEGVSAGELDALAARANDGRSVTIPTAVGFCMYLRRDCIEQTGLFDETSFPRGYGEENDFSMRARTLGWRHVLAADTFVYHEGGVSFGAERDEQLAPAIAKVAELHPGYAGEVQAFLDADPPKTLRRRIDAARISRSGPKVLLINHSRGGGTERHVSHLGEHLQTAGAHAYSLVPADGGVLRIEALDGTPCPNLEFRLADAAELDELVACLREIGIDHIHFHHTVELDASVRELPARLSLPYDFTVHDYYTICPRVNLIDGSGRYCGEPDTGTCRGCIRRNGSANGSDIDVDAWRSEYATFLRGARRVFVPSKDVALRMQRYFPGVEFRIQPHFEPTQPVAGITRSRRSGENLRVAVIGAIGPHKGSDVLFACARDAARRGLPLEFHVVGYTDQDEALLGTGSVQITGPYEESRVFDILERERCHVSLFTSVWPETFSYTLSIALRAGLFPVAFDLGAIAERLRERGWGELIPLGASASEINDALLALQVTNPPAQPPVHAAATDTHAADCVAAYYDGALPRS